MRTLLLLFAAFLVLVASKHQQTPYSREHKQLRRMEHDHRRQKLKTGPVLGPVIPVSFVVETEVLLNGRFIICPNHQVERCLTDRCLNYTCNDVYGYSESDCLTTPKDLCQEVTCGCDHAKGYFLKDNLSKECIHKDDPRCVSVVPDCSGKINSVAVCPDDCDEWTTMSLYNDKDIIYKGKCTEITKTNYKNCTNTLNCQCVFPYVKDDVTDKPGCVKHIDGMKMLCEAVDDHRELACEDKFCNYEYCTVRTINRTIEERCPRTNEALEKCKIFSCLCMHNYVFNLKNYFISYGLDRPPINSTKYCIKWNDCKLNK